MKKVSGKQKNFEDPRYVLGCRSEGGTGRENDSRASYEGLAEKRRQL